MPVGPRREDTGAAANSLTAAYDDTIRHPVVLHDDTLRDGEQTVGVRFSVEQKVEIADLVLGAGVHTLTCGFPAVAEEERVIVRKVLDLGYDPSRIFCIARAARSDVDAALAAGAKNLVTFVPTSDIHLKYKLKLDEDAALERITSVVKYATDKGARVRAGFEDGSRTPMKRLLRFAKGCLDAGAYMVAYGDTVGVLTPTSSYRITKELADAVQPKQLGIHFHNDLGLATANSLMAVLAGATQIQGSFGGLGERAGNVPLEEVAVVLRVKYGLDLGIDLDKLVRAARRILEIAGMPVAPCKAILGANVFSHESGIHVHGVTSEQSTYEPFPPELIGRDHQIHYGKHSGRASMVYLAGKHGIAASEAALDEALARIKQRAMDGHTPSAEEALATLREVVAGGAG